MMSFDKQRTLLMVMSVSLFPVALSYGTIPQTSLPWLFGIDASGVDTRHIFRSIMGLYLALIAFWTIGALRPTLRLPALWSLLVFVSGLATGRLLSLVVDGWPSWLLVAYMILEFAIAVVTWWLIARTPRQGHAS